MEWCLDRFVVTRVKLILWNLGFSDNLKVRSVGRGDQIAASKLRLQWSMPFTFIFLCGILCFCLWYSFVFVFFLIRFCFKHLHSAKKITVRKRSHKMNDTERCMGLEQDLDTLLSDITCKKNARFSDWGRGRETRLLASLSVLGILGWRRGEM